MSQDVGHNFSIVACFILHAFGRGAISKIEIAGKFCGPCEVRLDNPQAVILDSQLVSLLEPLVIFVARGLDRKSTRLNSSHPSISYAVFCLKKKNKSPLLFQISSPLPSANPP